MCIFFKLYQEGILSLLHVRETGYGAPKLFLDQQNDRGLNMKKSNADKMISHSLGWEIISAKNFYSFATVVWHYPLAVGLVVPEWQI